MTEGIKALYCSIFESAPSQKVLEMNQNDKTETRKKEMLSEAVGEDASDMPQ